MSKVGKIRATGRQMVHVGVLFAKRSPVQGDGISWCGTGNASGWGSKGSSYFVAVDDDTVVTCKRCPKDDLAELQRQEDELQEQRQVAMREARSVYQEEISS